VVRPIRRVRFLLGCLRRTELSPCGTTPPDSRSLRLSAPVLLLAGAILATNPAAASESSAHALPSKPAAERGSLIAFDIPTQSLASALDAYSVIAHREVVYNGQLAIGRQTAGVRGYFTPEAALQRLLEGTGLLPRYMAADAFVLVADDNPPMPINTAPPDVVIRYYGRIQASLRQAFCANSYTRPGDYRVAVGFRIGQSGTVSQVALLGSTGDRDLDAMIATAIGGLAIGAPPPEGFAQPVILMVTPQSQATARDCEITGAQSVKVTP
jgi:hypothetical protein